MTVQTQNVATVPEPVTVFPYSFCRAVTFTNSDGHTVMYIISESNGKDPSVIKFDILFSSKRTTDLLHRSDECNIQVPSRKIQVPSWKIQVPGRKIQVPSRKRTGTCKTNDIIVPVLDPKIPYCFRATFYS
jgi:hypothetical protein